MLSELFEVLPEAGDPEKPKLVFFFNEAYMLFADAPKALAQKIEQALEREELQRQKAVERRKARIERQIINTGAQALKRGIMGTLFGGRR